MYRTWFGIFILLFLLFFGSSVSSVLQHLQAPVASQLEDAAKQALSGDLHTGQTLAQKAHQNWLDRWRVTAAFSDHAPMDEIDGLLAQLPCYARSGNTGEFAACCTRCSLLVQAISEAHSLTWWNLL